jgi:hypothetical protein
VRFKSDNVTSLKVDIKLEFFLNNLTIVIKTILRPGAVRAVVDRFVSVLGAGVPVLVVDDSPEPIEDGFPPQVTVIPMEYDSGLSAGRNCGIAAVRTSRVFTTILVRKILSYLSHKLRVQIGHSVASIRINEITMSRLSSD